MIDKTIPEISIVIPLFNEEENIPILFERLKSAIESVNSSYEIIAVDDGSKDRTLQLLKEFSSSDNRIHYIRFSRNFGHQNSILAGMLHANGRVIITMDGDLQDPPELIGQLLNKYNEGNKVVYARRTSREGETFLKKATAKLFYRILSRITAIDIPVDTGDFRLVDRAIVEQLRNMPETNKFLRGQIAWMGYRSAFVEYDRHDRKLGKTKYPFRKMLRFAFDGITGFSNVPLQIATVLGFVFSIVAFLIICYALYSKFILNHVVTGWTSIMISSMFIGGVQLFCIGIIGEYLSRMGNDIRKRPDFIIEETNISNP